MNALVLSVSERDLSYLSKPPCSFGCSVAHDNASYSALLNSPDFDLILYYSDLKDLTAKQACLIAREINEHIPFIIVCDTREHLYTPEFCEKAGINEVIHSEDLARLCRTAQREVRFAEKMQALDQYKQDLNACNEEIRRLSIITSNTQNSVVITDPKGAIEWVNESFSLLTGYEPEVVKGQNSFNILVSVEEDGEILEEIRENLHRKNEIKTELRIKNRQNSAVWTQLLIQPVSDEEGTLTNYVWTLMEISGRKEAQQSLLESETELKRQNDRLRRAQRVAKLGDWTFDVSTQEITWSKELFHIYHRCLSEGPPSFDELLKTYYPREEAEKLRKCVDEAVHNAIPYDIELTVKAGDEYKYINHIGNPEVGENGKVIALHGIIQDVSAKHKLESELAYQRETVSSIADNANGILLRYVLYPDGTDEIFTITKGVKKIFGISAEDALEDADALWSVILDEDLKEMQESVLESARTGSLWDHFWRIKNTANEIRHIHGTGKPEYGVHGEVIWDSILLDVTEKVKLQQILTESESKYTKLFNNFIDEVHLWKVIKDEHGTITNWELVDANPTTLNNWKRSKEEVIGKTTDQIFNEDTLDLFLPIVEKIFRTGKPVSWEYYFPPTDQILTMTSVAYDDYFISTGRDITQKMKLENDLKENQYRLETAIDGADLVVWDTNIEKQTTIANDRWYDILGYEPGEVDDLYALFLERLHPDDEQVLKKELESIKNGEKEEFELIVRLKNKSGEYLTILDKGKAMEFDEDNNIVRMIGTLLDITEQVKLEQKLKENEFRLERATEGANLGIWDANIKTRTNIANERWFGMLGFSADEVDDPYEFFFSRIHPEDLPKINRELEGLKMGEKESFEVVLRAKHKSGEYITILDKGTALEFDQDGQTTRIIGTHLDITQIISTQEKLQTSLQEKELLIKEVHHRVKNNLAILAGLLELEIFNKGENSVLSDAIGRIRSIGFVHELLYQTESMVDVDFGRYLNSYLDHVRKTYNIGDRVQIHSEVDTDVVNVNEAVPLGLLINELITNSLKYGVPEEGTINISLRADSNSGGHRFCYADSGSGIDPEEFHKETLGLELIETLLGNLHAEYDLNTEGQFELTASFNPKQRGAFGNPVMVDRNNGVNI